MQSDIWITVRLQIQPWIQQEIQPLIKHASNHESNNSSNNPFNDWSIKETARDATRYDVKVDATAEFLRLINIEPLCVQHIS